MTTAVFGLVLALQLGAADEGWENSGTKNGTTLAYRDNRILDAREVRGTTELAFAFDAIVSVVCDLTRYTTLLPEVTEARLLDGTIPTDYEVYLRYAPRFLVVSARDVVLRVRTEPASTDRAGCSWSEYEGRVEPRKGTVRMPLLRGGYSFLAERFRFRIRDADHRFRSNPAITKSATPITPSTTFHVLMPPIVGTNARRATTTAMRIPTDTRVSAGSTSLSLLG